MIRIIHPFAGAVAILTIATFWLSTALSELFCSQATIIAVKTAIPWGFLLLVPAIAIAGGSGLNLAKGHRGGVIGRKVRRMPLVAANGLLFSFHRHSISHSRRTRPPSTPPSTQSRYWSFWRVRQTSRCSGSICAMA